MYLSLRSKALTVLFLIFSISAFSRKPLPKTLLWRISGNGLQKPSYLYGTFHLNDKRLFQFTDSMYRSIESTQGLAIEVNPDEMAAYFANKIFDQIENGKKLKDILSEKDFDKYGSALSKKLKKPADKITSNDILKEKNKWMADYFEKGEMTTFMDVYLYNLARRQGKWLGGVEDLADQTGLGEDLIDKSDIKLLLHSDEKGSVDRMMEHLIQLYTSQNIEAIDSFTNETSTSKQKDLVLTRRNLKMARRIDSLANARSMFFAIGAAHLPGDSGVIELLKEKGFTVDPVMSDTRIDPDKYTFKEVPLPWQKISDEKNHYAASMPGNPADIKLFGVISMKFLLDLYGFRSYFTMANVIPGNITNSDSLFNAVGKNMYKNARNVVSNKLIRDGIPGKEFIYSLDNYTNRVQLYFQNNTAYVACVTSLKKANVNDEDTKKFFDSFSITKNIPPTQKANYTFSEPSIGVKVNAPVELVYNKEMSKNLEDWTIKTYAGIEPSTGSYVFVVAKDVNEGSYIPRPQVVYDELNKYYKTICADVTDKERVINGNTCHEIIALGSKDNKSLGIRAVTTVKNNRNFIVSVVGSKDKLFEQQFDDFFNSLQINISSTLQWKNHSPENNSFTAWTPKPLKYVAATSTTSDYYFSHDSTTATPLMVFIDTLGKYRWYENDSTFWQKMTTLNSDKDSLLSLKGFKTNMGEAKELLIQKENKNISSRMKLYVSGNIIYKLFMVGDKDFLFDANTNKFFETFTIPNYDKSNFITTSKAQLILKDLQSSDSATRSSAYEAIAGAPFSSADLGELHAALFKKYALVDDSVDSIAINEAIARKLQTIEDTSVVAYIDKNYDRLSGDYDLKSVALYALSGTYTTNSYHTIAKLLDAPGDELIDNASFFYKLKDSLALTSVVYPHLLRFLKDSSTAPRIAGVFIKLIDSNYVSLADQNAAENKFLEPANKLLSVYKTAKMADEAYDYNIYNLAKLLAHFNSEESLKILNQYLNVSEDDLCKDVAVFLLEKNQPVNAQVLTRIATNKALRSPLYDDLKKMQKESLFPRQFLTQSYLAESDVFQAATDDNEPSSTRFLSKKTTSYKGKNYTFYLYKITYGEGDNASSYLGVSGGFNTSTDLQPSENVTGIYWDEEFKSGDETKQLKAYLNSIDTTE